MSCLGGCPEPVMSTCEGVDNVVMASGIEIPSLNTGIISPYRGARLRRCQLRGLITVGLIVLLVFFLKVLVVVVVDDASKCI